ncbi:hypothetical protein Q0590_26300 [Rhodocytophaga aerolata]|uniref:RNA polymerase alpha subunit C-terminal domain-containing protein n=1 Tax=Rhodocytophaga aerolata TaxID=455078 RepID=A0ABT8RF79_9BACT|nr:hypothetical protein [Rhodocytophaga aerolata]MDO1449818.1 hypothetical protein [Rhodocytophaga aerolata]
MSANVKKRQLDILSMPAAHLPVIDELISFMHAWQIANLEQLLVYSAPELLNMEGFGYRCLKSLYTLLEANGCEHLLKEE